MNPETEYSIFAHFLNVLWRNRKKIIILNIIVAIGAVSISLMLPNIYRGRTVFIVNGKESQSMINSIMANMPINLLGLQAGDKTELYYNFLTSHVILDKIDTQFDLYTFYECEYRFQYYKNVKNNLILTNNEDGTVTIEFFHKDDAQKAADIANAFYKELNALSLKLNKERTTNQKAFLQASYDRVIKDISQVELTLKRYQEKHQLYDIEVQAEQLIKNISELKLEAISMDVKRKQLQKKYGKNNNEVVTLTQTVDEIKSNIERIKGDTTFVDLPLKQIPQKGMQYVRYLRDLKIYNELLTYLIPQLENAKLEETKKTSDLQLLDIAVPEDYKSKPKRATIVIITLFLTNILLALFFAFKEQKKRHHALLKIIFSDKEL